MNDFLRKLDFKLLRAQKTELINVIGEVRESILKAKPDQKAELKNRLELLDGLVFILDDIQDRAVDDHHFNELEIFGEMRDEGDLHSQSSQVDTVRRGKLTNLDG